MTTASRTQLDSFEAVQTACRAAHGSVTHLVEHGGHEGRRDSSYEHCVVLCRIGNRLHPYAVWVLVAPDAEEGRRPFLNQGDYCETLSAARAAFKRRGGKREAR
jgi:hypothetical protein